MTTATRPTIYARAATPRPRAEVLLQPGEHFVGDAAHRIRTVLGSCVSTTLWCPRLRVGAMSHFLLASRGRADADDLDGRYGDEALALMLRELRARGVDASRCQAKIFGGGDMFPLATGRAAVPVGRRNGEAARSLLRAHGIGVACESLFGIGHRQIAFDIATGLVWSRQVAPRPDEGGSEPTEVR